MIWFVSCFDLRSPSTCFTSPAIHHSSGHCPVAEVEEKPYDDDDRNDNDRDDEGVLDLVSMRLFSLVIVTACKH